MLVAVFSMFALLAFTGVAGGACLSLRSSLGKWDHEDYDVLVFLLSGGFLSGASASALLVSLLDNRAGTQD